MNIPERKQLLYSCLPAQMEETCRSIFEYFTTLFSIVEYGNPLLIAFFEWVSIFYHNCAQTVQNW